MIEIKCITGKSIDINELSFFPGKLKKHSDLEIERVVESILKDGFLFPIGVAKVGEKKFIIDGEARINALKLLEYRGETIPKIPYYRIKTSAKKIKKLMLISASTNHCVTEAGIKKFIEDDETATKELNKLAFSTPEITEFHLDFNLPVTIPTRDSAKEKISALNEKEREEFLKVFL